MSYAENLVESPCKRVCVVHPAARLCTGCGRTLPEVARWHRMERSERLALMATLPERMEKAGLSPMTSEAKRD